MEDEFDETTETATLGNGCFWCSEAVFQRLHGVKHIKSGYSGGHHQNPDYQTVCTGKTGHAECSQIIFDPSVISYDQLLEVFWNTHDPTTLNRQGNDIGSQYRSVIFYHNEEQKRIAEAYKDQLNKSKVFPKPIITAIEPFSKFYPAEKYHDNYFNQNMAAPYCEFVIKPKLKKFRKKFPHLLDPSQQN